MSERPIPPPAVVPAGPLVTPDGRTSDEKTVNVNSLDDEFRVAAVQGQLATDQYGKPLVALCLKAEKRLLWKMDICIVPTVSLLYLFCFIDRANIGNARIAGMGEDLHFRGYDFNKVLSCFYISYILFEIPSNMLCKHMGPGWFIPSTTLLFGVLSICTAFVHTTSQLCAVRFLLGIFEAGMVPGIAYYMSRWYRASELTFRLGLYIVMAPLAGAFGGLLASAILNMDKLGSLHGWRVLFVIEGIVTCGLALIGFLTLTDRPETARWLSQAEKNLVIARLKAERLGSTEVLDRMDSKRLMRGMLHPVTLAISLIFLLNNITVQGVVFFTPTIVKGLYPGYSSINIQLRTVPPYVLGAFCSLVFSYFSWKLNRRLIFLILACPLIMVGYAMFLGSHDNHVRYGATFLVSSSAFVFGSMTNAVVSANVVSDTSRTAAIGLNVMAGNIGGLISTWSYLDKDAPNYHMGNGLNMATSSVMFLLAIALLFWMKVDNKKRESRNVDAELAGKSSEFISQLEWKHPAWRWRP